MKKKKVLLSRVILVKLLKGSVCSNVIGRSGAVEGRRQINHSAGKLLQKGTQSSAHVISACRQPVRREKFEKELVLCLSECGTFVNTLEPPPTLIS